LDIVKLTIPFRVLRGGSWGSYQDGCRAAYRYSYDPDYRNYPGYRDDLIGFRLLRPSSSEH